MGDSGHKSEFDKRKRQNAVDVTDNLTFLKDNSLFGPEKDGLIMYLLV
jgi:hypothetical protein